MFHNINLRICEILLSLPSRERGLKSRTTRFTATLKLVAPFAGAWIEIVLTPMIATEEDVAPFAGAWIEISQTFAYTMVVFVAPVAGAWIEIKGALL